MAVLLALLLAAADVSGVWSGKIIARDEDAAMGLHLTLKQKGNAVTGTGGVSAGAQFPIDPAELKDGRLSIRLAPPVGIVFEFTMQVDGDRMSGDVVIRRGDDAIEGLAFASREK